MANNGDASMLLLTREDAEDWLDSGELWGEVYQWILVVRRSRGISRAMAAREWRLLNEFLGDGRSAADVLRWLSETTYDEMKDMVQATVQRQARGRGEVERATR